MVSSGPSPGGLRFKGLYFWKLPGLNYTRQIKCDKTTKMFRLNKVLFHISVPLAFSQMTLDLHIRNRMKLRLNFVSFVAKRVPAVSYMVFLICGMLL